VSLAIQHKNTWRDKPESYWLAGLMEEVGELAGALVGQHEHSPESELIQIASICENWLRFREELKRSEVRNGDNWIDAGRWDYSKDDGWGGKGV
jgi:hypothetical protein